jgi:membrane protease YdiL (CAAX protease family)
MLVARANPWICLGLSFAWIALAALSPARHDVAALSVAQIVISNLVMYAVLVVAVLATAGTVRTGVAHGPWHVLKEDVFNPNPAVRPARAVGKGLVTGVALVALSLVVMAVVGLLSESVGCELREQDGIVLLKRGTAAGKAVILFSVVVLTPVAEELFFRYALEHSVEGAIGSRSRAMAYTSALFALMHGNLQAIPALFLVAAGCSFIYRRTGTLLAPVAAHAIFNLSSVMLVLLGLDS